MRPQRHPRHLNADSPARRLDVEVEVDGLAMRARAWAGPAHRFPVVLVHGLSISGAYMAPLGEVLAAEFPVYAPDFPGFGRSDAPPEDLDSVPAFADVLARWLDAMGIPAAAFVANSLGCQVVAELAARHPRRALAAVLVGPTGDPRMSAGRLALGLVRDAPREKEGLLAMHARDDLRAGPARIARATRAGRVHRVEAAYAAVRCPVLVVRGTEDPVVSSGWARRVAALVAHGRLVELPGAPHAANYSDPRALASAILPFLLRHAGATRSSS